MVIASDLTRWGFVLAERTENIQVDEKHQFWDTFSKKWITVYTSEDWMFCIEGEPRINGIKKACIFKEENIDRAEMLVNSPSDIYELLKKVGYL